VDEAYLAFAEGAESAIGAQLPNVLVLRSMTKDYALTGLRLGYAVGDARVIAALRKVRPPWNVNALALAAGVAALADPEYVSASIRRLRSAVAPLQAALAERGFGVLPTDVHFFLARVDAAFGNAAAWRAALRAQGVLVRDCASFGLPAYTRIAARRPDENLRLLAAIDTLIVESNP
jgi:histidinol-phosphate aminotransferase